MTYLFLKFFHISRLHVSSVSFLKLSHISKNFSSIFIEKKPCVSGPTHFKPVLFKGPLTFWGMMNTIFRIVIKVLEVCEFGRVQRVFENFYILENI